MGILETNSNQIIFIYNSTSKTGKQTLGYVESAQKPQRIIDTANEQVPATVWGELVDKAGITLADLFDTDGKGFTEVYKENAEFSDDDWFKVLKNNPELVICELLAIGDNVHIINTPSEVDAITELNHVDNPRSSDES